MSICIATAGKSLILASASFTLSWTHSIEKVPLEEDWTIAGGHLVIVEARVKGSGAGMEPPDDAVFAKGWWRYRPGLPPLPALRLASASEDANAGAWRICALEKCVTLPGPSHVNAPIVITPCHASDGPQ